MWTALAICTAAASASGQSIGARLASSPSLSTSSVVSNSAAITLTAVVPPRLSLNVSMVPLSLSVTDPSEKSPSIAVPVTSNWNLSSAASGVELIGFFDSPTAAVTDAAGHAVSSSRVFGGISQNEMVPFSENSSIGPRGASRTLYRQTISADTRLSSRQDMVYVQLGQIADLGFPAGDYRGVLHLRLAAY